MQDFYLHLGSGALISCLTALFFYRFTDIKIGFCVLGGWAMGASVGIAKEEIWDRNLKRGVPTREDKLTTNYGSMVGAIISIPIIDKHEKRIIEIEKYQNLKDTL